MITRGIVVDTRDGSSKIKVRIPILDGIKGSNNATEDESLNWASTVCFSGIRVKYAVGDVVVVGFEDNNIGLPIVLGHLTLVDKDMPSRVSGNFTDLETGSFDINYSVAGVKDPIDLFKANSDGIMLGGINYLTLTNLESATTIYDKSSTSEGINLNKTSGIQGGDSIKNVDLSPYTYLRVTAFNESINFVYLVNLTTSDRGASSTYASLPASEYCYGGGGTVIKPGSAEIHYSTSLVNPAKNTFYHYQCGYISGGNNTSKNSSAEYYISKIEGLKQG